MLVLLLCVVSVVVVVCSGCDDLLSLCRVSVIFVLVIM